MGLIENNHFVFFFDILSQEWEGIRLRIGNPFYRHKRLCYRGKHEPLDIDGCIII